MNDAGDEFSESAKRSAATALRLLIEKAAGKAPAAMPRARGRSRKEGFAPAAHERTSPSELMAPLGDAIENDADLQAWARTEDELRFLCGELEKAGVSFAVQEEHAPEGTVWRIDVPAGEGQPAVSVHAPLSKRDIVIVPPKADDEIVSLLAFFDRDRALAPSENASLENAATERRKPSGRFSPGSPDNETLVFRTVGWDPKARIIAGPLERQGIPFAMDMTENGVVFEFHHEDALSIASLADRYVEEGKLDPSRFDGLDRLRLDAPRARDRVLGTEVSDPVAAGIVRDCLAEAGVPFESWSCPEEGVDKFLVDERELAARSEEVDRALQARKPVGTLSERKEPPAVVKAPSQTGRKERRTPASDRARAIEASRHLRRHQAPDRTIAR